MLSQSYYYHATNLEVDAICEELEKYLVNFVPSCKVEQLESRNPQKALVVQNSRI